MDNQDDNLLETLIKERSRLEKEIKKLGIYRIPFLLFYWKQKAVSFITSEEYKKIEKRYKIFMVIMVAIVMLIIVFVCYSVVSKLISIITYPVFLLIMIFSIVILIIMAVKCKYEGYNVFVLRKEEHGLENSICGFIAKIKVNCIRIKKIDDYFNELGVREFKNKLEKIKLYIKRERISFGVLFTIVTTAVAIFAKLIIYYTRMGKFDYWGISRINLVVFGDVIDGLLFGGLALVIILMNFFLLLEWKIINSDYIKMKCGIWNIMEIFNHTVTVLMLFVIPNTSDIKTLFILLIGIVIIKLLFYLGQVGRDHNIMEKILGYIFCVAEFGVICSPMIVFVYIMINLEEMLEVFNSGFRTYFMIILGVLFSGLSLYIMICWYLINMPKKSLLSFGLILKMISISNIKKLYNIFATIIPMMLFFTYLGSLVYESNMRVYLSYLPDKNFIIIHENREQMYIAEYEEYINIKTREARFVIDNSSIIIKSKEGEKISHSNQADLKEIVRKNDLKTLVKKVIENEGETKTIFLNDKNWIMVYKDKEYYYANSYVEQEDKIIINTEDKMFFEKDTPKLKHLSLKNKQVEFTNKNIEG